MSNKDSKGTRRTVGGGNINIQQQSRANAKDPRPTANEAPDGNEITLRLYLYL